MDADGVQCDKHDAYECGEDNIDKSRDQAFNIRSHFLKFAQGLSAALILKYGVRQLERMREAIGIDLRAQFLCDGVDVVILEILCHAGDKSDANRRPQQRGHSGEKFTLGKPVKMCGIAVNDHSEYPRVEQGEDLVDSRQKERKRDERPVLTKITIQEFHGYILWGIVVKVVAGNVIDKVD